MARCASLAAVVCVLVACKKGDACEQVMAKLRPLIAKEGSEFTADDEAQGLARCRAQLAKHGKPDRTMQCILDSDGSESEVGACISGGEPKEARIQLRAIETKVKTYLSAVTYQIHGMVVDGNLSIEAGNAEGED